MVTRRAEDNYEDESINPSQDRRVPWQLRFAVFFGVPSLIAIYLVYWLTASIDTQQHTILSNQISILNAIQQGNNEISNYKQELTIQTRILEGIRATQYQICVNGLEPGRDTSKCFSNKFQD